MDVVAALEEFEDLVLAHLDQFEDLPERLGRAGFKEAARKSPEVDEDETPATLVLHEKANAAFAFSYSLSDTSVVSDVALLVRDLAGARDAVLNFVERQPNLKETTSEVSQYLSFAPHYLRDTFEHSRFWTAKAPGETGMNISLGPALWAPFKRQNAVALTVSPNTALQDELDTEGLAQLTGPGSRLDKFVHVFSDIAVRACPDIEKIEEVAKEHGYAAGALDEDTQEDLQIGANSLYLNGGQGRNRRSEDITSSIQVNCGSEFRFEFALDFILDPRLEPAVIQDALFGHLGIAQTARPEGVAFLELHGLTYTVRHYVHSPAFGNHYFLLQK